MRVIECKHCGELVSADDDDELTDRLAAHLQSDHQDQTERGRLAEFVAGHAYDATDS